MSEFILKRRMITVTEAIEAIDAEPELPGPIPDDIFHALKEGDRETVEEFCRIIARLTKRGIRERILFNRGGNHDSIYDVR